LRAPPKKASKRISKPTIFARLNSQVSLKTRPDGRLVAELEGYAVEVGRFSAAAVEQARGLSEGLPLGSLESKRDEHEIGSLVRRLARLNFLEFPIASGRDKDLAIIEAQQPDYWPRLSKLESDDCIVLSRFAYLRRRGTDTVLESPRASALFRICDPNIATLLAMLSRPQTIAKLRRQEGCPGIEFFKLLVDCQILFKVDGRNRWGLRNEEGDANLVLWDFHDLLFHARSTEGRHANPVGGAYAYAGITPALPAVRPRWAGEPFDLRRVSRQSPDAASGLGKLLRERHSVRDFDDENPITVAELAQFLDFSARVIGEWKGEQSFEGSEVTFSSRPYPSAGSGYELELYLTARNCEGLAVGFYHYDAGGHALVPIEVSASDLDALLSSAGFAMDAPSPPQILITMAARFGRISWKYSSIAYSLILKNVGALLQTFYLTATDMGLGGCAIGTANIELFARMTGLQFHVEGPVGQFALGRGAKPETSSETSIGRRD
jgi:SagB-type dehydrogenase family enzyme